MNTDLFAPRDDVDCEPGLVGFVGWLAPQKNLTALIKAMSGLKGAPAAAGDAQRGREAQGGRDAQAASGARG